MAEGGGSSLRFGGAILSALAALAPEPATAGAWIAPDGGQEIWTNVVGERDDLSYFESSAYWEAPLASSVSFVAAPWVEQNSDTLDGWRAETTLSLKHAVYRGEKSTMALQAGALWVSHPLPDCGEGGVEARWLGGRSVGDAGFINLEAASRALEGGCGGERAELTLGYRPHEDWLAMAQVFVEAPRDDSEDIVRAQITLVSFGENGRGIQFGLRTRIDGGDAEPAFVLGLWGRPGD